MRNRIGKCSDLPKKRDSDPEVLVRYQNTKQFHFLIFSCYHRKPLLATAEAKNITQRILEETRKQRGLAIVAYVLMPEHIHFLTN